jgi:hypothetical protein
VTAAPTLDARSRFGDAVRLEISSAQLVVTGPGGAERFPRVPRPVVVTTIPYPFLSTRPGLRLPRGRWRARALWFDDDLARLQALRRLHQHGWAIRPRRGPLVAAAVVAVLLAIVTAMAGVWVATTFAGLLVLGCGLQIVNHTTAVRRTLATFDE